MNFALATLMATSMNLDVNIKILQISERILETNLRNAAAFAEMIELLKEKGDQHASHKIFGG